MYLSKENNFSLIIRSSKWKIALIILPHFFSLILLFLAIYQEFLNIVFLSVVFLILSSLIYFYRLHLTRTLSQSVQSIHKDSKGIWWVVLYDGNEKRQVSISGESFESNILIILNLECLLGKIFTVLITPDSVTTEEFRVLKVMLKIQKIVLK